jgi:hypothetical protein
MGKFRLIGIGIALCVVSACSGGKPTCRTALQHAMDIYLAGDVPDDVKQQAKAGFDDGVKACEKENPPQEVLDCTANAKTIDDLGGCDRLRKR